MLETEFDKTINLVEIKINDNLFYIEMEEIKEIRKIDLDVVPIPLAEEKFFGMIDVRGDIFLIISLPHLMNLKEGRITTNKDSRILLLEYKAINIGFLVDFVSSIKRTPASVFESASTIVETSIDWKLIRSIGVLDKKNILLMDLEAIISRITDIGQGKQAISKKPVIPAIPKKLIKPIPKKRVTEEIEIVKTPKPAPVKKKKKKKSKFAIEISEEQKDILMEMGNIGSGNAITALSKLINKRIDVDLTDVGILSFKDLKEEFGNQNEIVCGIFCHIPEPSQSTILQVFELNPLMKLIKDLAGTNSKIDPDNVKSTKDLDEFAISTITEVGNILAGHYASSLADLLGMKLTIDIPEFTMGKASELGEFVAQEVSEMAEYMVLIKTSLKIIDFEMNGFFLFIPDLEALVQFFNALGVESQLFKTVISLPDKPIMLTEPQRDALQEIGNIGAGNSANALARLVNRRVDINIPAVEMVELDKFANIISKKNKKLFVAWSNVTGVARSTVLSIFKVSDIIKLSSIMVGDEETLSLKEADIKSVMDFPELHRSAISELGHILASHYTTALGNLLGIRLMTEPPDMSIDRGQELFKILKEEIGLLKKLSLVIDTTVMIKDIKITGTFLFIPELETLENLLEALSQFL